MFGFPMATRLIVHIDRSSSVCCPGAGTTETQRRRERTQRMFLYKPPAAVCRIYFGRVWGLIVYHRGTEAQRTFGYASGGLVTYYCMSSFNSRSELRIKHTSHSRRRLNSNVLCASVSLWLVYQPKHARTAGGIEPPEAYTKVLCVSLLSVPASHSRRRLIQ
jgi:hypothetical protein